MKNSIPKLRIFNCILLGVLCGFAAAENFSCAPLAGTATTQPSPTRIAINRTQALQDANDAYSVALESLNNLRKSGAISHDMHKAAYEKFFTPASTALDAAATYVNGGTDAEFIAELGKVYAAILQAKK